MIAKGTLLSITCRYYKRARAARNTENLCHLHGDKTRKPNPASLDTDMQTQRWIRACGQDI